MVNHGLWLFSRSHFDISCQKNSVKSQLTKIPPTATIVYSITLCCLKFSGELQLHPSFCLLGPPLALLFSYMFFVVFIPPSGSLVQLYIPCSIYFIALFIYKIQIMVTCILYFSICHLQLFEFVL